MTIRDGDWELFGFDQETGRSIWSQWIDGQIAFRIDTPVDHIIEANKVALNADHGGRFGDYVRVAAVPLQLYHQSGVAEAMLQQDDKFVSRFLNDSDNAAWRVREGRF